MSDLSKFNNISNLNNLSALSKSYYSEADVYEVFSQKEDSPRYILSALIELFDNQSLLDVGCGNGKYLELLSPYCEVLGLDMSLEQLKRVPHKHNVFNADASQIPLADNSVDNVLSCWMLGTILDTKTQQKALSEMKRVVKPGGKIVLVENNEGGEFEELRGRYIGGKTAEYNQWLLTQGFSIYQGIDTYFQFSNIQEANYVFKSIWADRLTKKIISSYIEHRVLIFVLEKD